MPCVGLSAGRRAVWQGRRTKPDSTLRCGVARAGSRAWGALEASCRLGRPRWRRPRRPTG
eukprot:scaffold454_cov124-Isochrysis_galbana.AAC.14